MPSASWINFIGALALFTYSLKQLADVTQKIYGSRLRYWIDRFTQKKHQAIVVGTVLTLMVQSAAAVNFMVISFVNAGYMALNAACGLVLGSQMGVALSAVLINVLALVTHTHNFFWLMLSLAVLFYYSNNKNIRLWAHFLLYASLALLSLHVLWNQVDSIAFLDLYNIHIKGYLSWHAFAWTIFIGFVFGAFVRSTISLSVVVCLLILHGLSIEFGFIIMLGGGLGTIFQAFLSDLTLKSPEKTSMVYSLWLQILGIPIGLVFLSLVTFISPSVLQNNTANRSILNFLLIYLGFNSILVLIFIPFINLFVAFFKRFSEIKLRSKQINERHQGNRLLQVPLGISPEVYILEANNEIKVFAGITKKIIWTLERVITETGSQEHEFLFEQIQQLEKQSDDLEKRIVDFLQDVFVLELRSDLVRRIRAMLDISHQLENLADQAIHLVTLLRERKKEGVYFYPQERTIILLMHSYINTSTRIMIQNLNENVDKIKLLEATQAHYKIEHFYKEALSTLQERINEQQIKTFAALYFKDVISTYRIIGVLLYKVSKTLARL